MSHLFRYHKIPVTDKATTTSRDLIKGSPLLHPLLIAMNCHLRLIEWTPNRHWHGRRQHIRAVGETLIKHQHHPGKEAHLLKKTKIMQRYCVLHMVTRGLLRPKSKGSTKITTGWFRLWVKYMSRSTKEHMFLVKFAIYPFWKTPSAIYSRAWGQIHQQSINYNHVIVDTVPALL